MRYIEAATWAEWGKKEKCVELGKAIIRAKCTNNEDRKKVKR